MTLDATARATADRLATQLGKAITYREVEEPYDPSTGTTTTTTTDYDVQVAPPSQFSKRQQESSLVEVGDLRVLLPATQLSIEPSNEHRVVIDSMVYNIIAVRPAYSGEQVAYYELQVRK